MLALYSLPVLFWFLFLIYSQGWVQPPRQMFILNIYVTCTLWGRRGRKLPRNPLQGAAFCPVTFLSFLWSAHLLLYLRRICQPGEFLAMPALRAPWSASLSAAALRQEGARLLHVHWQALSLILHHSLLCQLEDSMHSPQLWSCPDTSPDSGTTRSCCPALIIELARWDIKRISAQERHQLRSWQTKVDLPSLSSSAKIMNTQIWKVGEFEPKWQERTHCFQSLQSYRLISCYFSRTEAEPLHLLGKVERGSL